LQIAKVTAEDAGHQSRSWKRLVFDEAQKEKVAGKYVLCWSLCFEVLAHSTEIFGCFVPIYRMLSRGPIHHLQWRREHGVRLTKTIESALTDGLTAYRDHCLDRGMQGQV